MKQLLEALTALLKVKTIVTLVIIAVLAALYRTVKYRSVDQCSMIMAFYFVGSSRLGSFTLLQHLILQTTG